MVTRILKSSLHEALGRFPAVGLIGSRQVGKTTLAKEIAESHSREAVYLDLELPSDLAKLGEPELYLATHKDRLVILDEVQRKPELFPLIRSLVDSERRNGKFLILGSASPDLIRQSSESLAGRITYLELNPFVLAEVGAESGNLRKLWLRGGYPLSFLADTDSDSFEWREAFIRTHLETDVPSFGIRVPAATLRRFWTMLAHFHGQLWNANKIANSLGVNWHTVKNHLDILEGTFMVRRLEPYHPNVRKRLTKSPKVCVRDSGILHALLRTPSYDDLLGHPSAGASWEGWVLEQILALAPPSWDASFYRTIAGAEMDILLRPPGRKGPIGVEVKYGLDARPSRGFWSALADLKCEQTFVVYSGDEEYPLGQGVVALPATRLPHLFRPVG